MNDLTGRLGLTTEQKMRQNIQELVRHGTQAVVRGHATGLRFDVFNGFEVGLVQEMMEAHPDVAYTWTAITVDDHPEVREYRRPPCPATK